ncbi:hypothetical protein HPB47_022976, partial [Ixodes persulcatus]
LTKWGWSGTSTGLVHRCSKEIMSPPKCAHFCYPHPLTQRTLQNGPAFSACKSFCRTPKPAEEKQKWNCGIREPHPEAMRFSDLGLFELLLALLRAWRFAPPWDCQTGWCR